VNLSNRELILLKKGLADRIFKNRILGYNTHEYEELFERILIEQTVRKEEIDKN
jgi:hypothetical protein